MIPLPQTSPFAPGSDRSAVLAMDWEISIYVCLAIPRHWITGACDGHRWITSGASDTSGIAGQQGRWLTVWWLPISRSWGPSSSLVIYGDHPVLLDGLQDLSGLETLVESTFGAVAKDGWGIFNSASFGNWSGIQQASIAVIPQCEWNTASLSSNPHGYNISVLGGAAGAGLSRQMGQGHMLTLRAWPYGERRMPAVSTGTSFPGFAHCW